MNSTGLGCSVAQLAFPKEALHVPSRCTYTPVDRLDFSCTCEWSHLSRCWYQADKTTILSPSCPQMLCHEGTEESVRGASTGRLRAEQDAPCKASEASWNSEGSQGHTNWDRQEQCGHHNWDCPCKTLSGEVFYRETVIVAATKPPSGKFSLLLNSTWHLLHLFCTSGLHLCKTRIQAIFSKMDKN